MMQLWLNRRRIDSIPLLRRYTAELDDQARETVCAELLGKYRSGLLAGWLARQSEARPASALRAALLGAAGENVRPCRLMEDTALPPEEAYPILAWLCGVDTERFTQAVEDMAVSLREQERVRRQVEEQAWYQNSHQWQELFREMDWNSVACETEGLARLMDRHRKGAPSRSGQQTLYLCNTGRCIVIRDLDTCTHLRLVGCGGPIVRFDSRNRGRTLNMEERDLLFEHFCLIAQGVALTHTQLRLIDVEVKE